MTTMYTQTVTSIFRIRSKQKLITEVADVLRREWVEIQILPQRVHSEAEQIRDLHTVRRQAFTESHGILRLEEGKDSGDCPVQSCYRVASDAVTVC